MWEGINNAVAGDIFGDSGLVSVLGALWTWIFSISLCASVLPLNGKQHDKARLLVWSVIGFGLQSYLWLFMGFMGLLRPLPVVATAAILTLITIGISWKRITFECKQLSTKFFRSESHPNDIKGLRHLGFALLGLFLILVFRMALWPTIFYDDLVYHIGIARQALFTGSWPAMEGLHYSFMPAGWDATYVISLAIGGGSGPQIMNSLALLALSLAVYRLARISAPPAASITVTCLLLIAPVTGALGAYAGNDLIVVLSLTVALERLVRLKGKSAFIVGLIAGTAWSVKYGALPAVAGVVIASFVVSWRDLKIGLRLALTTGAAAFLMAVGWIIRSFMLTGNPLYPAFYNLLGGAQWSERSALTLEEFVSHGAIGDRGAMAFVLAIRDLLLHADTLGYPSGTNILFGFVGLAGLVLFRRVKGANILLTVWVITYIGWCLTSLNLRYALILLVAWVPFASALIQQGIELSSVRFQKLTAPLFCTLLLLVCAGPFIETYTTHKKRYGDKTKLVGGLSRTDILPERLNLAAAGRAMVGSLPADASILLVAEGRVGLLPRKATVSSALDVPDIARMANQSNSVEALATKLSSYTHVVVNYRELDRWREQFYFNDYFEPGAWIRFETWLKTHTSILSRHGNVVTYTITTPSAKSSS